MAIHEAYTRILEERLTEDQDNARLWNSLGLMLAYQEQNVDALNAFDTAVALNPRFVPAAVSQCFLLGACGQMEDGFRRFKEIAAAMPDDFRTVYPLGVFCMRFGWLETGLRQLLRAERLRPNVPFVIGSVSRALRENGFESEASQRHEKLLNIVRTIKIDALIAALEKRDESKERFGPWINPHLAHVHVMVARHLGLEGELEHSTYELLVGNSRFPGYSKLMVEMGRNLLSRERCEQAMEWFSAAILLDQNCHDGFFETSFLHASRDHLFLAAQALRHAVTLRPLFPDYRFHLGTLLKDMGETNDAIAEFRRALVIQPDHGLCELHLANALVEKGSPKDAIEVIKAGKCREWPEALIVTAQARMALGEKEEARKIIDGLVQIDPSFTDAHELLDATTHQSS